MPGNAHARAADPGAAVITLDETITASNSSSASNGQAVRQQPLEVYAPLADDKLVLQLSRRRPRWRDLQRLQERFQRLPVRRRWDEWP
jgi:hypothetical protein